MTIVKDEVMELLVTIAYEALRDGRAISSRDAELLDTLPTIDTLRRCTQPQDIEWILGLFHQEQDKVAGLACSLLRNHIESAGVRDALRAKWTGASPYLKNRIMWRLLDGGLVETRWNEEFLQFVLDNWMVFDSFNRNFYPSGADGIDRIVRRRDSAAEKKRWIYWLCLPSVVPNQNELGALLDQGSERADEFSRVAIARYRERIAARGEGRTREEE